MSTPLCYHVDMIAELTLQERIQGHRRGSSRQRIALAMREEGYTYKAIGEKLDGISPQAAYKVVKRAKRAEQFAAEAEREQRAG